MIFRKHKRHREGGGGGDEWNKRERDRMVTVGPKYLKQEGDKAKHGTRETGSRSPNEGTHYECVATIRIRTTLSSGATERERTKYLG